MALGEAKDELSRTKKKKMETMCTTNFLACLRFTFASAPPPFAAFGL
jgi:hypothetical protein